MNQELPNTKTKEDFEVSTLIDNEHEIILYNDDVNTFEHVIECLITICSHSALQAEQCAYLVHYSGRCACLLYTSPSPRDVEESRMPSSA